MSNEAIEYAMMADNVLFYSTWVLMGCCFALSVIHMIKEWK